MDRTCTICNHTVKASVFHWESHLASTEHRLNKMAHDNKKMIQAIDWMLRTLDPKKLKEMAEKSGYTVQGFILAREEAQKVFLEAMNDN